MQGTTPPTMQTPSDIAFQDPIQIGINNALATFQQATSAMFTNQRVDNETRLADSQIMLNNLQALDKKTRNKYVDTLYKYQANVMQQEFEQKEAMFPIMREQAIIGNSLARAQLAGTLLDNEAKEIENAWLPTEKQQEYDIKCATLFQMYLNGFKTEAEIKKIFADTALTYAKVATEGKQQKLLDEKIETEDFNQIGIDQQNQIRAVDTWSDSINLFRLK